MTKYEREMTNDIDRNSCHATKISESKRNIEEFCTVCDLNWLEFNLINSIFAGSSVHTFAHTYTRANAVELLQFSVNATFDRSQVIAQHIHLVFAIRPTYTTHTNARANAHTFRLCERETAFVFHRKSFHRYHQNRGAAEFRRTFPPIADYHTHENNNNHNIEKKWNSTQRYSY